MILSNIQLQGVRDQARMDAMRSFEFFANSVLASQLPEELCHVVQDVVEDQEDYTFHTPRPRALAAALGAWLGTRGVTVLSTVQIPQCEVLSWLDLEVDGRHPLGATIEVTVNTMRIVWL